LSKAADRNPFAAQQTSVSGDMEELEEQKKRLDSA